MRSCETSSVRPPCGDRWQASAFEARRSGCLPSPVVFVAAQAAAQPRARRPTAPAPGVHRPPESSSTAIGRLRAGRRPSRPLTPSGPSGYPRQPSGTTADAVSRPPTVSRWPPRHPCYVRPTRLDQAAGVRPTRYSGSYGVRSRSIAHATLSSRSETVRRAWPWRLPRPRSSPYRSRLAASCWIATRAQ